MPRVQAQSLGVRSRIAPMAALFLVCQAWAELTYASFFLIFALLLFAFSFVMSIFDAPRSPALAECVRVYPEYTQSEPRANLDAGHARPLP